MVTAATRITRFARMTEEKRDIALLEMNSVSYLIFVIK